MAKKKTLVVVFIFTDGEKILVEKRSLKNFKHEQYLIPGGVVKEKVENLEEALKREAMEELGIAPLDFTLLPHEAEILGVNGQLLIPFLINTWEGQLPKMILDKGTPLTWLEIDKVLNSPFAPTKKIAMALKVHLSKTK